MNAHRTWTWLSGSVVCHVCSSPLRIRQPSPRQAQHLQPCSVRAFFSNRAVREARSSSSSSRSSRLNSTSRSLSNSSSINAEDAVASIPIPKRIAAHLDEYVIGQQRAKRALAVGVFNHYLRAAASDRNSIGEESDRSSSTLKSKVRKAGRSNTTEEEASILTDFVGQTKGTKRWQEGAVRTEIPPHSLSSDFFSSRRPMESKSANSSSDRLLQSASRLMQSVSLYSGKSKIIELPSAPLEKSNMILVGPSGSGKTHLIRTLSSALSVPFVHVDATPLTSAGYVGEDVESIMSRLLEASDWNVEEAERGIVCIDEVDKLASPSSSSATGTIKTAGRDVGGTGVQQALLRLLEGSIVSIPDKRMASGPASNRASARAAAGNLSVRSGESKPWWSPEMQTLNAEHGKSTQVAKLGAGNAQAEALAEGKKRLGSVSGSDGQGTVRIDTSKVLFVLCGAFVGLEDIIRARGGASLEDAEAEDLTAYGLIPEFVGRLPVMVTLDQLTEHELGRILTEPRNALVSQYQTLFATYNIKLHFTTPAIASLAHQAAQSSKLSSGARVLRRLMEKRLMDAMFDGPNGGARYALMDEKAAQGLSEVQLFSRGGRSAWLNAIEEDEENHKRANQDKSGATPSKKATQTVSHAIVSGPGRPLQGSAKQVSAKSLLASLDEATLRRRARARLTRPSRVGNLRILTSGGSYVD